MINLNEMLARQVNNSFKKTSFSLVIGGDYSISIGSIAGASNYYNQDLAVVWIDSYSDLNTFDITPIF